MNYLTTAKSILHVEELDPDIEAYLVRIADGCEQAGGRLSSRQAVSVAIAAYQQDANTRDALNDLRAHVAELRSRTYEQESQLTDALNAIHALDVK